MINHPIQEISMTAVDIARLIVLIIIVAIEIFWFQMFRDMVMSEFLSGQEKKQWTIMFILLNVFASILYFFNEYRRHH
jgi:hypothetical protein